MFARLPFIIFMPGIKEPLYTTEAEDHVHALDEYYRDCFPEKSIRPNILETTAESAEFTVRCTSTGIKKYFTVSL